VSGSLIAAVMAAEAAAGDVAQSGYIDDMIFHSHRQHQARAVPPLSFYRWKISLLSLELTSDVVAIIN
jgi:hypothetical protein